jgi:hypothetical protein
MESIDPLNTLDSIAPHSTSFSSNIYLLKHEEKTFTKGQLLSLTSDLSVTPTDILYFTVGSLISPQNFNYPYTSTSLCRLYGYKITNLNNKIVLTEKENNIALGRAYVVAISTIKSNDIPGSKVGTWNDFEVWADVKEEGIRAEGPEGVWDIMKENFGESLELAYYWFVETGVFKPTVDLELAGDEEIKILESLDIGSLINEKN